MELNAIISSISARPVWPERPSGPGAAAPSLDRATAGEAPAPRDSFERGQWWKNRARPRPQGQPEGAPEAGREKRYLTAGRAEALVRELNREEQLEVARLQQLDTRVKAHEMAHLAVAGPYARGGASFSYTMGPDGKKYATGGEVSIDSSKEPSPEATIRKMRIIRAAAMAPADPSPQDRKVAAQAAAAMVEARRELELIRLEQQRETSRRELDMLNLNAAKREEEGQESTEEVGGAYAPPPGRISPIAARQAAATLAGLNRSAGARLDFTA
ncbi:putative metalloprotease CJM1_0395 family protein [Desulfurivibrio sp. D14AmB]|uniref:putative metalloprotease CJM1_0395 family protein n=1 Tax=Desulfurivibrio sp. D14AmB TaxID=3374370 RepID=UPI00376ED734